jgi:hemerythrin superfamily protein
MSLVDSREGVNPHGASCIGPRRSSSKHQARCLRDREFGSQALRRGEALIAGNVAAFEQTLKGNDMAAGKQNHAIDAIAVLMEDHAAVENLFGAFERAEDNDLDAKGTLVRRACELLAVHAMIEEEILYPTAREFLADEEKTDVDEALVEHFLVKTFVEKFDSLRPSDDGFDATFKVLTENVRHHVEEEEGEFFPELRKTKMDLSELGKRLMERKDELMAKLPTDAGDRT